MSDEDQNGSSPEEQARAADSRVDAIAIGAIVLIVVGLAVFYVS